MAQESCKLKITSSLADIEVAERSVSCRSFAARRSAARRSAAKRIDVARSVPVRTQAGLKSRPGDVCGVRKALAALQISCSAASGA